MSKDLTQKAYEAMNKITKWRTVFTGWQLGTRAKGDPECDAVRDHREITILLRVEGSAILGLLMKKGVFAEAEFQQALIEEVELLEKDYEKRFPGIRAFEDGIQYDRRAIETMKHWKP